MILNENHSKIVVKNGYIKKILYVPPVMCGKNKL